MYKNMYEITLMVNKNCSVVLIPGLKVNGKSVSVTSVGVLSTFLSILLIPAYVTDEDIVDKIVRYNNSNYVANRKYSRRKKVAYGTKYFQVNFRKK